MNVTDQKKIIFCFTVNSNSDHTRQAGLFSWFLIKRSVFAAAGLFVEFVMWKASSLTGSFVLMEHSIGLLASVKAGEAASVNIVILRQHLIIMDIL